MNPNMCKTDFEYSRQEADDRGPIETALELLGEEQERAEKALRVLSDRIASVTQPEEPSDGLAVMDGEKSGYPQSPVLRRLNGAIDDLSRLTSRIHRLADRVDC